MTTGWRSPIRLTREQRFPPTLARLPLRERRGRTIDADGGLAGTHESELRARNRFHVLIGGEVFAQAFEFSPLSPQLLNLPCEVAALLLQRPAVHGRLRGGIYEEPKEQQSDRQHRVRRPNSEQPQACQRTPAPSKHAKTKEPHLATSRCPASVTLSDLADRLNFIVARPARTAPLRTRGRSVDDRINARTGTASEAMMATPTGVPRSYGHWRDGAKPGARATKPRLTTPPMSPANLDPPANHHPSPEEIRDRLDQIAKRRGARERLRDPSEVQRAEAAREAIDPDPVRAGLISLARQRQVREELRLPEQDWYVAESEPADDADPTRSALSRIARQHRSDAEIDATAMEHVDAQIWSQVVNAAGPLMDDPGSPTPR